VTETQNILRRLVMATVILYLVLVGFALYIFVDAAHRREEIAVVATEANDALCALRQDLERRVAASEAFLEENPEGIPGLSPKIIREGIENQTRTIVALNELSC
jgi:high-affinity Fe2+/Pb2+ permease